MKKIWIGAVLAGSLTLWSCGGGEKPADTAKSEGAAPAGGTATPDEANGGTVTGKVAFTGDKPKLATLDMSAQPKCEAAHKGETVKSEEVVVNANGTLKNAFVWIKAGLPDKQWAVPANAVTLDQHGCMYQPHVIGIVGGQNIEVKNSDPTNHNIHPQPSVNAEWNESQSPGEPPKMRTFARQEVMIPVKCNVHPWMRSYIGVVGHPFFAVTGDDGTFTIKGLPPGTYTLEVWHEKYGTQDQQVTVGAKESKTVDFSLKG
jgi:carboxypeptidase family protein